MPKKVIIDCDGGIDDTVALCMALFDPRLEVLAITAAEGCVEADQATKNLQLILESLNPDRFPRLGQASPAGSRPPVDTRYLHGDNGLGNVDLGDIPQRHHGHPSSKVIIDMIRAHPGDVTLITLGPLSNVATAFRRDPTLVENIDQIVMMGGSLNGIGNITAPAEFNIYYDPESARTVFRSRTTKTLIPLDVTTQVTFGMDLIEKLPSATSNAGHLLRRMLPFFFNAFHQRLGKESIVLNDAIALLSLTNPEIFETRALNGDVEISGEITRGVTVFDRRSDAEGTPNMAVATAINIEEAKRLLIERLNAIT